MGVEILHTALFLHGIGGGKYDQLGDQITEAFFQLQPPHYAVLSATLHLPGTQPSDAMKRIRQLKRRIRETRFQGERFSDLEIVDSSLVAQKRELLSRVPPRGERVQWHKEITSINEHLAESLGDHRDQLSDQLSAVQRELASAGIRESREHSFCVYPLDYLTKNYAQMLPAKATSGMRP